MGPGFRVIGLGGRLWLQGSRIVQGPKELPILA